MPPETVRAAGVWDDATNGEALAGANGATNKEHRLLDQPRG
jgi:hypothetical protein